jgi:predicted dehydrogenase
MGKGWSDWTPMLKSGLVEIVAFCDCDYNVRNSAQMRLIKDGIDFDMYSVPFYTDYRKLLDHCGVLGVEAMTISTPDHVHAPVAVTAMKQGIHVFVQKPLVRTLWELDYFGRTAKDNGVIVQMGNQGSALDSMRRCTEVIQSGILGDVTEVHVWTNRPVWPQGKGAADATLGAADPIPAGFNWDAWLGRQRTVRSRASTARARRATIRGISARTYITRSAGAGSTTSARARSAIWPATR